MPQNLKPQSQKFRPKWENLAKLFPPTKMRLIKYGVQGGSGL